MVDANPFPSKNHPVLTSSLLLLRVKRSGILLSLLYLLFALLVSSAVADEELVCQKGVSGFPGATFPKGDILLKEGDTLEVYCRLDLKKTKYNATFINFRFTKANISENLMRTTVINETTALLQVERMNVSSPHLSCEIAPPGLRRIQVCQNEIDVGYPPMPVENFRCLAQEWRSLNCTWTKPYNPIPTSYSLQILQKGKSYLSIISCPNTTSTPTSCVWGPRTDPFYRQNLNPLNFRVNGTNVLNPRGSTWDFSIEHWSIVIPEAPSDLRIVHPSPEVATVGWAFKTFKDFPSGLVHQITVCIQNFTVPCNVTKLNSYKGSGHLELNVPLHYAYVNYTVNIQMRSQRAKDEPTFWSKPSMIIVPSEAKSPIAPPNVDIGSYESVPVNNKKRDIFVYWEEVDLLFRNGPGFNYVLSVQEDEEMKEDSQPKEITRSYAKYIGLALNKSYRFTILSANDLGNSSSVSTVYVPRIPKAPVPPTAVSQLDYNNGSFAISWNPVNAASVTIVSYTVFRCTSTKPRPHQCQGLMKWDVVSAEKQSKVYDFLPHDNLIYQFAVAANTENMSSGMAWASCTLIHGKVPKKLDKVVKIFTDEKEIHIEWRLECSYKPGVIDGYKISYCRVEAGERNKSDRCFDNEKQEAVSGSFVNSYHLKKLQPCSTYMISVSIISSNGDSQKSDPIYATTKPSAPSNPPIASVVKVTNTSALISIKPQFPLNGVVRDYRIKYKSSETGETVEKSYPVRYPVRSNSGSIPTDSCFDDGAVIKQTDVEIKNLLSNSNYSFTVSACTSKCSEESSLVNFKTDVGYTDMTTFPDMHIDGDDISVVWHVPSRVRGPITEFQILLKQNGKSDEIVAVPYERDANSTTYFHKMKFSCETSTNLTAQVRAVTVLDTRGETLYGGWSSPGNFNCGGGASWIVWVGVIIGAIIIIGIMGIVSTKIYQKLKEMKEVVVKLPPGMAVQDLNGFTHPKRRGDSDGDTQSFGKDKNLSYQMTTTNHSDDSKDFASLTESCLQDETEAGCGNHGGEMSFDNKVYSEELEIQRPSNKADSTLDHGGTHNTISIDSVQITSLQASVENESLLAEKRLSVCPTNPLLEEEEQPLPLHSRDMYSNIIPVQEIFDGLGFGGSRSNEGSPTPFSSSPYPASDADDSSLPPRVPDVALPGRTGAAPSNPVLSAEGLNLPAQSNPTSSYVKWTQMMPDQFMNGDSSIGVDHAHKAPYCQVGILLDSN